jgi:hypothetical protein
LSVVRGAIGESAGQIALEYGQRTTRAGLPNTFAAGGQSMRPA